MKKLFTICAAALMALCSTNVWAASPVTLASRTTTNNYVPLYCSYGDTPGTKSQFIYPASMLTELRGNDITSMTFHANKDFAWDMSPKTIPTISVSLKVVEKETLVLSDFVTSGLTEVYKGQPEKGTSDLVFEFATAFPFPDEEKNLLVEVAVVTGGGWQSGTEFHGTPGEDYGASYSHYGSNNAKSYFLPEATVAYSASGSSTCAKPTLVSPPTSLGAHEVSINWNKADASDNVQYALVEGTGTPAASDWSEATDAASKSYDNLKSKTTYTFYVRTYCDADNQSAADKIQFTTEQSCFAPLNLTALSVGATSAQVSWEDSGHGEVGYQCVHVAKDGVPDWNQAASFATGEFNATINGLSPLQSYDVYVRSVCAGSEYSEVAKININTPCGAIAEADLPWNEDFTGVTGLPDCWERLSGTQPAVPSYGTKVLVYSLAAGASAVAVLPEFANAIQDLTLDLVYTTKYSYDTWNTTIEVGYIDNSDVFHAIGSAYGKTGDDVPVSVDLADAPTEAVRIALRGTAIADGFVVVKSVTVSKTPACANPKNLARTALTHNSASFAWEQGETEEWYQYAVVTKGSAVGSWTKTESANQHTATVGDLTTGTEYEFVLRSWCSDTKQGDEQRIEFTPVCAAPSDLAISNITHTSATIGWTANGATKWTIAYRRVGASTWEEVSNVTENPFSLSPLQSARDYQVKVKSTEPCISDYCSIETFTTKCAPKPDGDLPFSEDFESNLLIPDCWMVLPDGAQATVITMGEGGNKLYMVGADNRYLVLPEFEKALSELTLEFSYTGGITPEVGYLTAADGATFSLLETPTASPAKVDLKDAPAGAKYVAIHYTGTESYHILYVDDVKLYLTSSTTGIEGVQNAEHKVLKTIENGQLILIRDGVKYNAQGAKL